MRKLLFASAAMMSVALAVPALAQGTTPDQYLTQAMRYAQQQQAPQAIAAVNAAESLLLEPPTPYEFQAARDVTEPPVIRQMGRAREALQNGDWGDAEHYIAAAMSHPTASLPGSLTGTVGGPNQG